jgi:hypothetical protein
MTTKSKTFDCVESKRNSQEVLEKEFETRRREFTSFSDFLNAKTMESTNTSEIWKRFNEKTDPPESS